MNTSDRRRTVMFAWALIWGLVFLLIPGLALAQTLPAKIQAENYRSGGEGTGYHDTSGPPDTYSTSDTGGGYAVDGWETNEWLAYDVTVPSTGDYDFTFRVAAGSDAALHVLFDTTNVTGSVEWGNTGGHDTFTDITVEDVSLTAGNYVMKIVLDTGNWTHCINWVDIASAASNTAPSVGAGSDDTITWPTDEYDLDGTVSDDGNPNPPGTYTVTWTKQSGPGTVTFNNANAVDTTATFSASGTYVLRLTADDDDLTDYDDVTIEVNAAPSVDAGSDDIITWPTD